MEKYAKKLQDIINEQDFCFETEEIKTVEKALGVLKMYEDANIPAEACAEYRKFEDELDPRRHESSARSRPTQSGEGGTAEGQT